MLPVIAALVAPLLQNGLSLIANAVVAKGQQWVEDKTGVKLAPNMTPEQLAALKQAEATHEEELQQIRLEQNKLDLEEFKAALADLQSARNREVQIATAPGAPLLNKVITPVMAIVVIVSTFILFAIVMFNGSPVEPSRKDILIYILGALTTLSAQVAQYYFGSSKGSHDKDQTIRDVMK